jgi:hypothetical protein
MFRLLNTSESGIIDVNEFYYIYDVLDMKWRVRDEEPFWFSRLRSRTLASCAQQVHRLVTWNIFDYFVCESFLGLLNFALYGDPLINFLFKLWSFSWEES